MSQDMDYEKGGTQKDFYSKSDVENCPCPFCDTGEFIEIYKERGSLGIVRCSNCDLIYVNKVAKYIFLCKLFYLFFDFSPFWIPLWIVIPHK